VTRPNVLLLVLDALRRDAIEPFGAPAGASPALTELANRGLAVSEVRSTAGWTLPSHFAMFTGDLARGFGLGQAPAQTPQSAAPVIRSHREKLLAEVLRGAGYTTRGITTNVWAGKASGFDTGFDEFVELDASRYNFLGGGMRRRLRWDWDGLLGRGDDGAAEAQPVVERWVSDDSRQPCFVFVNLVECHSPYIPPRSYGDVSALTRLRGAHEAQRYLAFDAVIRICLGAQTLPEGVSRRMRQLYAASVKYADDWLRRVISAMLEAGTLDNTLVIVCSDHGENFGEGGLISHSLSLDDRLLRVPFIAAGPGAENFQGMHSLAELPARVAAAVGLSVHPWGTGLIDGLPVAQWDAFRLESAALADFSDRLGLTPPQVRRLTSPLTCAVSGNLKLVRGAEETDEALYDLEADPLELVPVRGEGPMESLAGPTLSVLRNAIRDPSVITEGVVSVAPDGVSDEEAADIERKMRLLGYL
jgi:arylsulfatase A-like enzyme